MTSSLRWIVVRSQSLHSFFSTYLLPSILSIIPSFLLVFKIGLVLMAYLLIGSHLYPTFSHGWPQTFYLTTLLELIFFSLDFQHNFLKSTIPHLQFLQIQQYNLFLLFEILVLFFYSNLSFSDHISYISKSCFSRIRDLRRIRNTLDHKTDCTIETSLNHS